MKQKGVFLRGVLLAGLLAGVMPRLIPVMQAVQIGTEPRTQTAEEPQTVQPENQPEHTEETAEEITVTMPAETAKPELLSYYNIQENGAIPWESESSRAMHFSRPYQNNGTGGGKIVRKHFGAQTGTPFFQLSGAGQVRNCTFWSNADLKAESEKQPALHIPEDGSPAVLLYHTHTTESYPLTASETYGKEFNFRTTEPDKNMVAVGDAIAAALEAEGIRTVHASEIHDFPKWNGSYNNSARTIKEILKKYPSICAVFDIHRDAISNGTTVTAPVCTVNGKQSAQIMIISGCDNGKLNMPDYRENFHFACALQRTAESMFPGLTRPILFDYRKYNQDLTHGSLLIEVGSQGNSLEEACYAGELIGKAVAQTLRNIAENNRIS